MRERREGRAPLRLNFFLFFLSFVPLFFLVQNLLRFRLVLSFVFPIGGWGPG